MSLAFQILTAVALIGVCGFLIVTVAKAGDEKGAVEAARRRRLTPYTPPSNARQGDFDRWGRTW